VLTSKHIEVTAAEMEDRWSFDDLMTANEVLDALEDAEQRAEIQAHG
jgi:hypothetical protein